MAKIRLGIHNSSGTYLKDSNVTQHQYPSIEVSTDDDKPIIEVSMTFSQFAMFLCASGQNTACTLSRFVPGNGAVEKVEPPPSLVDQSKEAFGDTYDALLKRMKSLHDRVYDTINGPGKAGKNELREILGDVSAIQANYATNHGFMLSETQEKVEAMRDDVVSQISSFLAQAGRDPQLGQSFMPGAALPPPGVDGVPVEQSGYTKVAKEPDDMTNMELADHIDRQLSRIEKFGAKTNRDMAVLYSAGASESPKGVIVRYVSFQGTHLIEHDKAIRYLKFLRGVLGPKDFKTDYWFEEKE